MDSVLQGLEGVVAFIDDILVTGETEEEHLQNLDTALQRLEEADFTLKKIKCSFMQPEIDFLGYHIDADGRHPMDEEIRAIKEAPTPKNVSELCSFLGLVNYYSKFLPNLSTTPAEAPEVDLGGGTGEGLHCSKASSAAQFTPGAL